MISQLKYEEKVNIPVYIAKPQEDGEEQIVLPIFWYESFQECQNEKRKPTDLEERGKFINEVFWQRF